MNFLIPTVFIVTAVGMGVAHASIECPLGTQVTTRQMGQVTSQWCAYADGTRHGPSFLSDKNGLVLEQGNWTQGQRDGDWSRYTESGLLVVSGQYERGQRVGIWTNTDPDTDWSLIRQYDELKEPVRRPNPPEESDWIRWSMDLEEAPIRLIPVGQTVVVLGPKTISAIEIWSGEPILALRVPESPKMDVVVDDQRVAFVTAEGAVMIADLEDSGLIQLNASDPVTGIVALKGDELIVRTLSGTISALDLERGSRNWVSAGPWGRVGPVFLNGVLFGVQDRYVHQIDPESGLRKWRERLDGRLVELIPAYSGEQLFTLDKAGRLTALDPATGVRLWQNDSALQLDVVKGAHLRDDQDALLVINGVEILRLDQTTGELIQRLELSPEVNGQFDLLDSLLCSQGPAFGLSCEHTSGAFGWTLDLPSGLHSPLVLDRMVLSVQENRELLAIDRLGARIQGGDEEVQRLTSDWVDVVVHPESIRLDSTEEWVGERRSVPWVNREILDQDCERTTLLLDVIDLDVPLGTEVVIEDLEISSTDLDAELLLQHDWYIETLEESWQVDLLGTWIPTLEQAWPRHEDPGFEAMMTDLARCDRAEMVFDGTVVLDLGDSRRQLEGTVKMEVLVDLAPEQGCLIWVYTNDSEPILVGTALENSRVWLRFRGYDELPLEDMEALVDFHDFEFEGDQGDRLEFWFSDMGEPEVWESDGRVWFRWQDDGLYWVDGMVQTKLNVKDLVWPEVDAQGEQVWRFDLIGPLPVANEQGLVPLVEVNRCGGEPESP